MTTFRILTFMCAAVSAGGLLYAQEAGENSDPGTAAEPAPAAAQPTTDGNAVPNQALVEWSVAPRSYLYTGSDASYFNLVASTHANTLGVEVAPLGEALRTQLAIEGADGLVVTGVTPESPAAQAGLREHDVVLKLADEAVASTEQFQLLLGERQGQETILQIVRRGQPLELTVKLPNMPVYNFVKQDLNVAESTPRYRIGVTLAEADDTLRSQLQLATGEGLVVTEVVPNSAAAKGGLQRHDVLIKLDNQRLTTVDKINAQVQELKDRQVEAVFLRGGEERACELTPQLSSDPAAVVYSLDYLQPLGLWTARNVITTVPGQEAPYQVQWFRTYGQNPTAYEWLYSGHPAQPAAAQPPASDAAAPIAALKAQLAEMHKTLEALEAALQPAAPQPEQQETKD